MSAPAPSYPASAEVIKDIEPSDMPRSMYCPAPVRSRACKAQTIANAAISPPPAKSAMMFTGIAGRPPVE